MDTVTIVCQDDSKIEISFNCNEDEKSIQSLTFRLHPQPNDTSVVQSKTAGDLSEVNRQMNDVPVGFIIQIWKYKDYLIVQHSENDFSIYKSDGSRIESYKNFQDACSAINELIDDYIQNDHNQMIP